MNADQILRDGTIVIDHRNDSDNSRMQVVSLNNITYLIIKKAGEIIEFVAGNVNPTSNKSKEQIVRLINKMLPPYYKYQTGGGVLKHGESKAQYHYLEFILLSK